MKTGKVFPASENARDVLNHLLMLCRKSDVQIVYNSPVNDIKYENGFFRVSAPDSMITAACTVISAGGFTYPSTGSDGSGYRLAESLGHSIVEPHPSLAGITVQTSQFKNFSDCSGLSIDCGICLYRNNSKVSEYCGRLLFTHKGLSGPVIIDNSRDFYPGDELKINLFNDISSEHLSSDIISFCRENGKSSIRRYFKKAGLPDRLISAVFLASGSASDPSGKAAELSTSDRKKICNAFSALSLNISSLDGKNKAMCTAGGVETSEINPGTMESRIIPGLYFAGEVIDVDGDSGGFNLQFAFSSAAAAVESIIKSQGRYTDSK